MTESNKLIDKYNAKGEGKHFDNWGYVKIYLDIDKNNIIKNIGYKYKGCALLAYTLHSFIESIKGLNVNDALHKANDTLKEKTIKEYCSECNNMIIIAFINACEQYKRINDGKK